MRQDLSQSVAFEVHGSVGRGELSGSCVCAANRLVSNGWAGGFLAPDILPPSELLFPWLGTACLGGPSMLAPSFFLAGSPCLLGNSVPSFLVSFSSWTV